MFTDVKHRPFLFFNFIWLWSRNYWTNLDIKSVQQRVLIYYVSTFWTTSWPSFFFLKEVPRLTFTGFSSSLQKKSGHMSPRPPQLCDQITVRLYSCLKMNSPRTHASITCKQGSCHNDFFYKCERYLSTVLYCTCYGKNTNFRHRSKRLLWTFCSFFHLVQRTIVSRNWSFPCPVCTRVKYVLSKMVQTS